MKTLFSVPNLLSLGNLLCGCVAILNVIDGNLLIAVYLVLIACVFDFLDGFAARGLKQGSPMGKELDSLADMVTFGVLPGMIMFQLLKYACRDPWTEMYLPYVGFVIPLFSALRLAKFNVDSGQSSSFIGLPTLANALFIAGLPLVLRFEDGMPVHAQQPYAWRDFLPSSQWAGFSDLPDFLIELAFSPVVLVATTVLFSFLLISAIPMFSFKVKNVKWKGNEIRYIFLALAIALTVWLKLAALPLIIVAYIGMSVIYAIAKRSQAA